MKTRQQLIRHRSALTLRVSPLARNRSRLAFTLIELLVVIAIIGLLAGLVFPITAAVNRQKIRTRARAELVQIETAILTYKAKMGHFPPDNPVRRAMNPLYYELNGTRLNNGIYQTLDGTAQCTTAEANSLFGVSGFVNATQGGGGDEGGAARKFLIPALRPPQIGALSGAIKIIVSSIPWPKDNAYQPTATVGLNPICYNSSNPTNNANGFDLWVDVIVGGQTNRICNWSKVPLIVGQPYL